MRVSKLTPRLLVWVMELPVREAGLWVGRTRGSVLDVLNLKSPLGDPVKISRR